MTINYRHYECILTLFTCSIIADRKIKPNNIFKEVPVIMTALNSILKGRRSQPHLLIEVLQDAQDLYGYIPEEAMNAVSRELGVPLMKVYRVACFYKAFSLKPRGKYVFTVCTGTACHVRGANLLLDQVKGQLNIEPGETTEDGLVTIENVNCVGACALGPVVIQDGAYCHHMTPGKLRKAIDKSRGKKKKERAHA
ncbi:MAG: NAD(P)H-dependent oxidoreductase subunit E [Syntrophobacterales bacterium CG_4_8_14_3_um_filter_58_8]|nr:MAG: NAD(P)H-dependent oxidoreductase subunit E [Syntrophobacterales bacterium CG03_land_8_20_14_0_80_58_14]PJC71517.1 MAG: NAD(P)H-dependent oxidoreductase subunit E [Syntrophobacterales bacterium CG_4_8_14_3_um_filter_58_8]